MIIMTTGNSTLNASREAINNRQAKLGRIGKSNRFAWNSKRSYRTI